MMDWALRGSRGDSRSIATLVNLDLILRLVGWCRPAQVRIGKYLEQFGD